MTGRLVKVVIGMWFFALLISEIASAEERDLAGEVSGFVDIGMPSINLRIPAGYFYWEHLKTGGWKSKRKISTYQIGILATRQGLEPYSRDTRPIFQAYSREGGREVLSISIWDWTYRPDRNNDEYINLRLDSSMKDKSEHAYLEKYIPDRSTDRVIYLSGKGEAWARNICYTGERNECKSLGCRNGLCLSYEFSFDELSRWIDIDRKVWTLVEGFKIHNAR